MAVGEPDVQVRFGVNAAEFAQGLQQAVGDLNKTMAQMRSTLGGLASAFGVVKAALAGLVAGLSAGALFKQAVSDTVQFIDSSEKLARRLGTTAEEASVLQVALDNIYVSTSTYIGAQQMLTRQLRTNEEDLNKMGVVTRDSNKQLVDQKTLMFNAIEALKQYKEGTDRNAAAMRIFGRGGGEVNELLKLTAQGMEEARQKAERLGLTVRDENVRAVEDFKAVQNDLGDVLKAFGRTVGDAVLPMLTQLGQALVNAAESALPVFRGAVKAVMVVLIGLKSSIEIVWEVLLAFAKSVVNTFLGMGDFLYKLLSGDFKGAADAIRNAGVGIQESWSTALDNIYEKSRRNRDELMRQLGLSTGPTEVTTRVKSGAKEFRDPNADKKEDQELLAQWRRELEERRRLLGDYRELEKSEEAEFWREKLKLAEGHTERLKEEVLKAYASARRAAAKEEVANYKEDLRWEMEMAKEDGDKKIALQEQLIARMAELYGTDSREYIRAVREKTRIEEEEAQKRRAIIQKEIEFARDMRDAELRFDKEMLGMRRQLGLIDQQQEVAERQMLEQRILENKRAAILEQLQLDHTTVEQRRQLNMELERIDLELRQSRRRMDMENLMVIQQSYAQVVDTIMGSLQQIANGFLQGTMTWRKAMMTLAQSIVQMFLQMGFTMVRNWIMQQLVMTKASAAGEAARVQAAAAGAAATTAIKTGETAVVVSGNAAQAASGAAASQASIPYIGPVLAIAAAVAMLAFVLGLNRGGGGGGGTAPNLAGVGGGGTPLPSAAGGWWSVPTDTLAQIHKREMVLPAPLADSLRGVVEGGGAMSSGPTIVVQAMDSEDVSRFLRKHATKLVKNGLHGARLSPVRTF